MATEQTRRRIPKFQFRVLIMGRANAGKTTILQRVCETTESPTIYRGNKEVKLEPSMDRGEHRIDDELVFSNHKGYIFHDSQGIEAGDEETLEVLKEFIQRKCGEKRLRDRLHAIWFCVPMDNYRPQLALKYYQNICPDQNVPVIAVFTKYDQFLFNVEMDVADYSDEYPDVDVSQVAEKQFQEHYLRPLGDDVRYVRLQKMHMKHSRSDDLIETTASALNEDAIALMLLAVQRGNLELSVKTALSRVNSLAKFEVKHVIRECVVPFPYVWYFQKQLDDQDEELSLLLSEFHQFTFEDDELKFKELNDFEKQVVLLPTIQHLVTNGFSSYHLILAVILILKHATFLRLSNSSESALSHADIDYRKANIDLTIQRHLKVSLPMLSVEQFAGFIMATEIVPSQSSVETGA